MLITTKYIKENYSLSRMTLLAWEAKGVLHPLKTSGGARRYKKEELDAVLGDKESCTKQNVVLYARVSTKKQEPYLQTQIERLKDYADNNKITNYSVISEIASGVNENRRGILKLLTMVSKDEVSQIIVEYPDRLARFGLKYLELFLKIFGVKLTVLNEPVQEQNSSEELAEDLVSIVASFAARIYGKRSKKNRTINIHE